MADAKEQSVAARIERRLTSDDASTRRAGGRAVALQGIEHRLPLVRQLQRSLARLRESPRDAHHAGYLEALTDVLEAAEAALAPRERMMLARTELTREPRLWTLLRLASEGPLTPGKAAAAVDTSAATGTRDLDRLLAVGLLTELPAVDGRERWHRTSPLGDTLLATVGPDAEAADVAYDGVTHAYADDEADDARQVVAVRTEAGR